MSQINFFKVTTLPAEPVANSFYFVENGTYAESYITDTTGATRSIGNSAMINQLAKARISELHRFTIVEDITARDALTVGTQAFMVLVLDATNDTTVDNGAALYAFDPDMTPDAGFRKVAEYESMDIDFSELEIDWSQLVNGPDSTPAQIDDAVSKAHSHANKLQLDKIGESAEGYMTYDGTVVGAVWDEANW